ncbi:MAG: hypothetical protein ACTSX3_04995 [Candidatus Thorarchaeota archaeon]
MVLRKGDRIPMAVWCPLIPPDEYPRLAHFERDLRRVSQAYDDWLAAMRGKPFVGTTVGVLLDRIRMLLIEIGVACAQNRELAETVQRVLVDRLRSSALRIVGNMPDETPFQRRVKSALKIFFQNLRFARDIIPEEEIELAVLRGGDQGHKRETGRPGIIARILKRRRVGDSDPTPDNELVMKQALIESSNVVKRLYMRLLSPDPWGCD